MPDDLLDAAQKQINDAAKKMQGSAAEEKKEETPPPDAAEMTPQTPSTPASPPPDTLPQEPAPEPVSPAPENKPVEPANDTPPKEEDKPTETPVVPAPEPKTDAPDQPKPEEVKPETSPAADAEPKTEEGVPTADASKLMESVLEPKTPSLVVPPKDAPKPGPVQKRKGISKAIVAVIALLLLALPVGVYYISQQNQQIADIRNRATGETYCGDGRCTTGESNNACPSDCSPTDPASLATGCRSGNMSMCHQLCDGNGGSGGSGRTCVPPGTGCSGVQGMEYACTTWHWTTCIGGGTNGVGCGTGGGGGGGGGGQPTPTNTPPPVVHQCTNLKIYKGNTQVTPSTLLPGDVVTLAVKGNGTPAKARFRINGGAWSESTTTNGSGEFTQGYTVPDGVTDFVIESEVFVDGAWK